MKSPRTEGRDNLMNIGHGFNLHNNHLTGWQHIDAWIKANIVNN